MLWQGYVAIILVSIQFGIQPFLSEHFLDKLAIKSVIVIVQEIVKIICCSFVLLLTNQWPTIIKNWTFKESIITSFIPALIYCSQNVLAFYAYLNLDPLIYNLINQSKVIFAAICLKLILGRSQTKKQMIALAILFFVSIMLTIDSTSNQARVTKKIDDEIPKNVKMGLVAILLATMMSGLAGTLTQKALQSLKNPRNSLLFSIELGIYGIFVTVVRLCVESQINILDGSLIMRYGVFYHWNNRALVAITVNAIGGIGVGLIAKYASVIHKSYALISGILLSALVRSFIFNDQPMTFAMYIAVPCVVIAMYLNTKPKSKGKTKKKKA